MARTNATNRTTSTARVADGYRLNRQEHSPSASFNGSSTGITLGFKANSTGFTIAAWIKVRRFTSGDRIFDQQDSGPSKGFAVLMPVTASDRSLYFSVFGDSSEEANIKIALNIWEWTHIAISFEPNSAKFYKNGVLAGTDTSVSLGDSVTNLVIGKNASSAANYFNGLMKDFVVYDRVLSLAEVENVRDGIVSQTNLKCYLPLSSDLADISVNGNDGTGTAVFTYTNDSPFYDAVGLNMYAPLKSSLLLERGVGYPTWSRATKAWGFNELGYLEELASGCAFFGGARLVRNTIRTKSEDFSNAAWTKTNCTVTGTNTIVCANATSNQYINQSGGGTSVVAGTRMAYSYRVKRVVGGVDFLQIVPSSTTYGSLQFVNISLVDGSYVATGCSATVTSVSADTFDVTIFPTVTVTGSDICSVAMINAMSDIRLPSFIGDGIKSFQLLRAWSVDVTNYDASYVPEYVSVGVEASPYFGAGIDGAKYFETDWQGAPIAAASLLGFRREAAAINNLLSSRNLTVQAITATNKRWDVSGTSGAEVLTNGTFAADLANWTLSVGAGGSITATGGICTFVSDGTGYTGILNDAALTVGQTYVCIVVASGTGTLKFVSTLEISNIGAGTSTFSFVATGTTVALVRSAGIACNLAIDSISIKAAAVQCALVTGLDGIANTATTLTATAADATILQPTSGIASAARCASAYVKRRTGTGTISFTQDGGTWTDITSQINSSTWSRVQITATLANPSVGFKISTSGDAIDVDCVQNEAGSVATSPIITTTATVTRNADSLTYQTAGNIDFAVGTIYCEVQSTPTGSNRNAVAPGNSSCNASNSSSTSWRAFDGTTVVEKTGLSDISTGKRKRANSWGPANTKVTGDGLTPASGAFDGLFGDGAILYIAQNFQGYIGPVAIYNYQMTDAELQALTT